MPVLPPVGIPDNRLDKLQQEILNLGYRLRPHYHPVVIPYLIADTHVLVLWALGGQNRPYKAPASLARENREYAAYIRKAASTVRASQSEERELLELSATVPFDGRINQRASTGDLQAPLVQLHLSEIGSELFETSKRMRDLDLFKRMKIVDGPEEHLQPRNVGLLFFSDRPDNFYPQTQIDVVQLPEGPGGDIIRERTFVGPLGRQLRDALSFIQNNVVQETIRKLPDRAEAERFFNYPYASIEEALVNAVYHRSYEEREPIEVRVLPDHLTITSYPGPDRSISIEDLETGSFVARRYRNRRIGEFLKELNLTEGRGTGVPKIIRAMQANGSPHPQFRTDENRSYFVTILPIHPHAVQVTSQVGQVAGHVTDQVERQLLLLLDDIAIQLLSFCRQPRSRAEIQKQLNFASRHNFRINRLRPLLDAGLLEMTESNAPRSPTQKYRTTELGKSYLAATEG